MSIAQEDRPPTSPWTVFADEELPSGFKEWGHTLAMYYLARGVSPGNLGKLLFHHFVALDRMKR